MSYMGRKVFVSVLGVGFYGECIYKRGDFESEKTRFIQQATLEMLTNNDSWTAEDQGYILLTEGARVNNWIVGGNVRMNKATNSEETYLGLKETIHEMNLPFAVEGINIPVGNNEDEIWQIFDVVFGKLQDGDELYFDITHGFRYLPMLVLVLGNYAKFLKRVTVRSITYGNFESADKTLCPPVAPIIDITSFSALQDWTIAASDFLNHGDATRLASCGTGQLKSILRETKGKDIAAANLNVLCKSIGDFSDSVRFCRGIELYEGKASSRVVASLLNDRGEYLKPLMPLLHKVSDYLNGFEKGRAENIILASDICIKSGNWQAAITLLQEGVVTFFCARHNLEIDDQKQRMIVNKAFKKKQLWYNGKVTSYEPLSKDEEKMVDEVVNDDMLTFGLALDFQNLTDVRNDINHAGMRNNKDPMKIKNLKDNIEKCLNHILECINEPLQTSSRLFLNLSNHPSSKWSKEQLDAAAEFGKIVDMPFPAVDPDCSFDIIENEAEMLVREIKSHALCKKVVVHVMGEMGLTYCIVKKLSAIGIRCVCSTSYRIVKEEDEGKRLVEFHFNKFRDYE